MTFTERNFPAPEPSGEVIPMGVRASLMNWLDGKRIASPTDLWGMFRQREGYATMGEVAEDILRRFGEDPSTHFKTSMAAHIDRERSRMAFSAGVDYAAEPALLALPTPQFLDVLEIGVGHAHYDAQEFVLEINRLFAKRGVNYRFSAEGLAEWHGDEGAYETLTRPALDTLSDPRLNGARSEFHAALMHMRTGSTKDLEDAVEEAAKSVESIMKVVLLENHEALSGKEAARQLFGRLSQAGLVPSQAESAVLGAAHLRNAFGAHGSGAAPRVVPLEISELTVRTAASAICFLARRLP